MDNAAAIIMPSLEVFGIRLVGVNAETGKKLLFSVLFLIAVWLLDLLLRLIARQFGRNRTGKRVEFWTRQGIHLLVSAIIVIGLLSIWFSDPGRLTTFLGLFTAGLAFALQRVVTAIAGYFILLGGKSFNVGDRITMGGVRGDVIELGFFQTTIMEMGQPPGEQADSPAMWVQARQYTGRVVTVTNDKIFDEPVYNYSREFPYIWEELHVGISYKSNRRRAEEILLEAARRHTIKLSEMSEPALAEMERRYFMRRADLNPRVFYRLTDNWIQMALRFITHEYGIRELKDRLSRDILEMFEESGIEIASGTYDIVGLPPVEVQIKDDRPRSQ